MHDLETKNIQLNLKIPANSYKYGIHLIDQKSMYSLNSWKYTEIQFKTVTN